MVSIDASDASVHGGERSNQRLKQRRAAEKRLKFYGLFAISLAALSLVALVWSVAGKATGVIFEHYITLETDLSAEALEIEDLDDATSIRRGNYTGVTRDLIRSNFDFVTERRTRRQLNDLVSVGAASELQDAVVADPSLIGTQHAHSYVASDIVDLYLKNRFGRLRESQAIGTLDILVGEEDVVELSSDQSDFSAILADVKSAHSRMITPMERQIGLENNGIAEFERRLAAADEADKPPLQAQVDARTLKREKLEAELDALIAKTNDAAAAEMLSRTDPSAFVRVGDGWIKLTELGPKSAKGVILAPIGDVQSAGRDAWSLTINNASEASRKISDNQIVWTEMLRDQGAIEKRLNWRFLQSGDSREPELAGVWGAVVGSFWTMVVTICLAFPIGVGSAIYLEEFAPKNRLTDLIEVNINNLAAVPSIIFGLLGLSIFLGVFGVPRSAPLAGGIVLALMTLPTIIIAARASIRSVPPSIRDAALGLGASRLQTSFHHVLPLAMPGILTGTIIGMAQALGETAPLILIGMVAFIVDIPTGITDSATALPVQIFRWSDFPERAFEAKTAGAICVLLVFLVFMNALAVFLRKQFERRW